MALEFSPIREPADTLSALDRSSIERKALKTLDLRRLPPRGSHCALTLALTIARVDRRNVAQTGAYCLRVGHTQGGRQFSEPAQRAGLGSAEFPPAGPSSS